MAADLDPVETRTVAAEDAGSRVDRWFRRHYPGLPFGQVARLLRTGQVRVDGRRVKAGTRLEAGQSVRVPPLLETAASSDPAATGGSAAAPDPASLAAVQAAVLYRDAWVLALNKPPGLATQGGTGVRHSVDGLAEGLRFGAPARPRLVHRLDKDTSGVLILGRSAAAADALARAFRGQAAHKVYWALIAGHLKPRAGRIDRPIAKLKRGGGEKMAPDPEGKTAQTAYATIATTRSGVSWVALSPLTGRTHQLRVHMADLGTPILGDGKYGGRAAFPETVPVDQLQLHAREIAVPHPEDGTTLRLTAPLPAAMAATFEALDLDPDRGEGLDPVAGA